MVKKMRMVQPLNLKPKSLATATATDGGDDIKVAFKNCSPFTKWITHINDEHVDSADNLDIADYSDTWGSLWQFKRDGQNMKNENPAKITTADSTSFKYKSSFIGESIAAAGNRVFNNIKIAVPLKYLSNFWRSLEMSLVNCKIHLELNGVKIV